MQDYLKQLKDKRDMTLNYLTEQKLEKSTGRDVVYINDLLNKNVLLSEGKATERLAIDVTISTKEDAEKYINETLNKE